MCAGKPLRLLLLTALVVGGLAAAGSPPATAATSLSTAASDRSGDAASSHGDLTGMSVSGDGTTITTSVTVVAPTDPATDANWQGPDTGVDWFFDTNNDGTPEWDVSLFLNSSNQIEVDLSDANGAPVSCSGMTGAFHAGSGYSATLPAQCVGNPAHLFASAEMQYDLDPQGTAQPSDDLAPDVGNSPDWAAGAPTQGYWLLGRDGGVFSFGTAAFYGSTGNLRLNQPVVGLAPTPGAKGYWFVASDGGIFAFGDAAFFGSTGAMTLNQPIVGMAATPDGRGYWLVASDGGIFAFGDAAFFGSTGAIRLQKPIVGMAATADGRGYWFVASDGGIFAFGDAFFHGAGVGLDPTAVVGMAASLSGGGYRLAYADGAVRGFGDAVSYNTGSMSLSAPVVGLATQA